MKLEILKYLEDIHYSIEAIERYTADLPDAVAYAADLETIDSVERRLGIIGEALFQANKLDENLPVTDKKKIIGLRHILVHDYDLIDNPTIWEIVQKNLPALKLEIQHLLT